MIYNDQTSSFEEAKDNYFIVYYFNIESLALEILKVSNNIVLTIRRLYYQILSQLVFSFKI